MSKKKLLPLILLLIVILPEIIGCVFDPLYWQQNGSNPSYRSSDQTVEILIANGMAYDGVISSEKLLPKTTILSRRIHPIPCRLKIGEVQFLVKYVDEQGQLQSFYFWQIITPQTHKIIIPARW